MVAVFGLVCAVTRSRAAGNAVLLPKPKPRAVREHLVMPSIHSPEVTRAQRSGVRHGEDAFYQLDFGNGLFNVHPSQYLTEMRRGQFEAPSPKTVTVGLSVDESM
jgi:hypothetical protein